MTEGLLELVPVSRVNFKRVVKLKVEEHEEKFVAPNMYSIAEAYVEPETYPMAIYYRHEPVGFMLYGKFIEDKGEWWIGRLMVDKAHRRQGIAERASKIAIENMKKLGADKNIFVSFVPTNVEAKQLYKKLGFVDTGREESKETVYRLDL